MFLLGNANHWFGSTYNFARCLRCSYRLVYLATSYHTMKKRLIFSCRYNSNDKRSNFHLFFVICVWVQYDVWWCLVILRSGLKALLSWGHLFFWNGISLFFWVKNMNFLLYWCWKKAEQWRMAMIYCGKKDDEGYWDHWKRFYLFFVCVGSKRLNHDNG